MTEQSISQKGGGSSIASCDYAILRQTLHCGKKEEYIKLDPLLKRDVT